MEKKQKRHKKKEKGLMNDNVFINQKSVRMIIYFQLGVWKLAAISEEIFTRTIEKAKTSWDTSKAKRKGYSKILVFYIPLINRN